MASESKTLEELRSKIETYLRQKELSYEVEPNGDYGVRRGSTIVRIVPTQWHEQTLVRLYAPVALDVTETTPELTRFLAEKNSELLFGKFSLDTEHKAIWYEHTLLGDFLDPEELFVGVAAIVAIADEYDEEVSKMAGGKRAIE